MGTIECHRSTVVAVFVQKSSIIAHGRLWNTIGAPGGCWHSRVL